jgi:prepilin-type N-terminal cleavage/methylation domain-containing protein
LDFKLPRSGLVQHDVLMLICNMRECWIMLYCFKKNSRLAQCRNGFSLIELVVVIAIMAIIMAIAIPSFVTWRENMQYRQAGRELTTFIRTARSRAISTNRQQRVELIIANRSYHIRPGDRAVNSAWGALPDPDVLMPSTRISLAGNNVNITCNPNGTMEFAPLGGVTARITIFDNQTNAVADVNSQRYRIDLTQTGRIAGNPVGTTDGAP